MHKQEILKKTHTDFTYKPDKSLDKWIIHKNDGKFTGDCEDFTLTLLYRLSNKSIIKFWLNIITFQATIWFVKSYEGDGHAVLWYKGQWADNMESNWYKTSDMRHTRRFPYIFPLLIIKLLIGKLVK